MALYLNFILCFLQCKAVQHGVSPTYGTPLAGDLASKGPRRESASAVDDFFTNDFLPPFDISVNVNLRLASNAKMSELSPLVKGEPTTVHNRMLYRQQTYHYSRPSQGHGQGHPQGPSQGQSSPVTPQHHLLQQRHRQLRQHHQPRQRYHRLHHRQPHCRQWRRPHTRRP